MNRTVFPEPEAEPADAHAAYQLYQDIARNRARNGFLDFHSNQMDRDAMPFLVRALPVAHEMASYPTLSAFVADLQRHTASDRSVYFNAIVPMNDRASQTVHTVAMSVRRDEARTGARLSLVYVEPASLPAFDIAEVQAVSELTPMHRMGLVLASVYHDFFGTILPAAFDPASAPYRLVISMNLQKSARDCAMFSFFLARRMTRELTDPWHRDASLAPWPRVLQDAALALPPRFYKHASSVGHIGQVVEQAGGDAIINKRGESLMTRTHRYVMRRSDKLSANHNGSILLKREDYVKRALATLQQT
ncbi:hypothetical protein [Robbsia sp. KACC 23696]|uniref:YopJ family acetyltransferase n=1 Tax=Robbsia sp. KACC 23696 TaxID=3149231 RepID=UPI00325B52CB